MRRYKYRRSFADINFQRIKVPNGFASFTVQLTSASYRRSPLIQDGLEIHAKVIVTMTKTVRNHLLLEKYEEIINDR